MALTLQHFQDRWSTFPPIVQLAEVANYCRRHQSRQWCCFCWCELHRFPSCHEQVCHHQRGTCTWLLRTIIQMLGNQTDLSFHWGFFLSQVWRSEIKSKIFLSELFSRTQNVNANVAGVLLYHSLLTFSWPFNCLLSTQNTNANKGSIQGSRVRFLDAASLNISCFLPHVFSFLTRFPHLFHSNIQSWQLRK